MSNKKLEEAASRLHQKFLKERERNSAFCFGVVNTGKHVECSLEFTDKKPINGFSQKVVRWANEVGLKHHSFEESDTTPEHQLDISFH